MNWILGALPQVGAVINAGFSGVMRLITSGAQLVYGVFRNVASFLWNNLRRVIITLVGIIAGAVVALRLFVKSTQELARNINAIRNQTGLNNSQSMAATWQMKAFGIGDKDMAQMTSNPANMPFLFRMRAQSMGLPGYEDPNFITALNKWYQSHAQGQMGRLMANNMINGFLFAGSAPAGILQAANMPAQRVGEQSAWMQNTMNAIGIDPDTLAKFADELPLLQARLGLMFEMIKVKFVTLLLPLLEELLNAINGFASEHLDSVLQFIQNVARWLYVDLPIYLARGAQTAVAAITWLVGGFFTLAQGAVNLIRTLEDSNSALNQYIIGFLQVVDGVVNGVVTLINIFQNVGVVFHNISAFIYNTMNRIYGYIANLPPLAQTYLSVVAPALVSGAMAARRSGYDFSDRMEMQSMKPPIQFTSNLAGLYQNVVQPAIANARFSDRAQGTLDSWRDSAINGLTTLGSSIDRFSASMGDRAERQAHFDKMIAATDKNTDAVKGVEKAVRGLAEPRSDLSGRDLLARVLSYIAQDEFDALVRS